MKLFVLCWIAFAAGSSAQVFECKTVLDPKDPSVANQIASIQSAYRESEFKLYRLDVSITGAAVTDLDGLETWRPASRGIPLVNTGPVQVPAPEAGKTK